jgi:hypothetical protein
VTITYRPYRRRGRLQRGAVLADDFTAWLLHGTETWLVALLKGVPLFLFVYFLLTYIPNYVYYLVTQHILQMSDDVGFLIAQGVGFTNFVALIVLALLAQYSRGRRGLGWTLIRIFIFLQYVFVLLVLIPLMVFNLAGGTFFPQTEAQRANPLPLPAVALGLITAALGAAALVYLYLEYRRITAREARRAEATSAAYLPG